MIKKYSIYFSVLAGVLVIATGVYRNVSFDVLIFRTVVVVLLFYILGNMLGVITIEALLENQNQKVERMKGKNKANEKSQSSSEDKV